MGTRAGVHRRLSCPPVTVSLASCSASPLAPPALRALIEHAQAQADEGSRVFGGYADVLDRFHATAARLLAVSADDVSFHRNATEALSLIANGYPFEPGDEVVGYVDEYPANHYPWRALVARGVRLVELDELGPETIERALTARTRVVALSHVQFVTGFALDVDAVAALCRERGIDLVLDGAQSLGVLPLEPESLRVAAVAASGWKWLRGPIGSGLMYTSPDLRSRLAHVVVGAETMRQGVDYLDHSWAPHDSAKRFEYATSSPALVAALEASISDLLDPGPAAIRAHLLRLQDLLIETLDPALYEPLLFPDRNRSGILALRCARPPEQIVEDLAQAGFVATARGGYLRIAPHHDVSAADIARLAETLDEVGR
jgi:cysteine desulfurase/selenocysteine lyase